MQKDKSPEGAGEGLLGGAGDLVSKVTSRVIIGVTPFWVLITLPRTYLLSPLPLQVRFRALRLRVQGCVRT